MNFLLIRHQVADFASWKASYDSHTSARESAGLIELHVLRTIDQPNEVIMLFTVTDLDKARAFVGSDELRAAMEKAGVTDRPDVYFLH